MWEVAYLCVWEYVYVYAVIWRLGVVGWSLSQLFSADQGLTEHRIHQFG